MLKQLHEDKCPAPYIFLGGTFVEGAGHQTIPGHFLIGSRSVELSKNIFRKSNKRCLYSLVHIYILFPNFVGCCVVRCLYNLVHMNILFPNFVGCYVISLNFSLYQCFQNHDWSPKMAKIWY